MPENALALLHERGFVQNVSDADGLRAALDRPIVFYLGVDPSASSLTVGHLVPIMLATHLQRAGHHAIFVGGRAAPDLSGTRRIAPRSAPCSPRRRSKPTWPGFGRNSIGSSTRTAAARKS